jgi:hypothetical protein
VKSGLLAAVTVALFVAITSCDKSSPTEIVITPPPTPTPTRTPTATPTPVVPGPAGLFGTVCVSGDHGPCQAGPAAGIAISITQGSVTLQAVSGADGSYTFPVGGGLVGPGSCRVSTTAPEHVTPWQGVTMNLTPGLNGPVLISLAGPGGQAP